HSQLKYPNGEHNEKDLIILKLRIVVESIAKEEERADHRVHDVIGKRHLPYGLEPAEQRLREAGFIEENERGNRGQDQEYPLEGIDQVDPLNRFQFHEAKRGFDVGMVKIMVIETVNDQGEAKAVPDQHDFDIGPVRPLPGEKSPFV